MRLYFDTNVFSQINHLNEIDDIENFLVGNDHRVIYSDFVVQEKNRIDDAAARHLEFFTIARLSTIEEWIMIKATQQMLGQIAVHRPQWLSTRIYSMLRLREAMDYRIRMYLQLKKGNAELADAKRAADPLDSMLETIIAEQKDFKEFQKNEGKKHLYFQESGGGERRYHQLDTTENRCKEDLFVQINQMIERTGMLDMDNCLGPKLSKSAYLQDQTRDIFFFEELDLAAVNMMRMTSLLWHLQAEFKLQKSNHGDVRHAMYLDDVDAFFTRDRRYFELLKAAKDLVRFRAAIVFLPTDQTLVAHLVAAVGRIADGHQIVDLKT